MSDGDFVLEKCPNCSGKRLFQLDGEDISYLCMDCRYHIKLSYDKVDSLSWWIWKRQYQRTKVPDALNQGK
jgi:hypothetical protein